MLERWKLFLSLASLISKYSYNSSMNISVSTFDLKIHFGLLILTIPNLYSSTVRGKIDQVNQVLELKQDTQTAGCARYSALDKWTSQLNTLHTSIVSKV